MTDGERAFRSRFGDGATARIVVPGRVNLIGDHIDYCGLTVLPTALQRRLTLLCRARHDGRVRIATTAVHEPREFEIGPAIPPFAAGDWGNYAKAAVAELAPDHARPRGFDALIDSDLPPAAGLSSSSALVVAAALAFLHANEDAIDPLALAGRLAAAERYVGTGGGGMDQAILLLAEAGRASRIDFWPLRARPLPVPDDWRFVVAHSLVDAAKSGPARKAYNDRPREAERSRAAVAAGLGVPDATWRDLIGRFGAVALIEAARSHDSLLCRRLTHVVTESDRVEQAVQALDVGDAGRFGALMTASHKSLRDHCEVSHPALDRLVSLCLDGGGLGARLTGAGFGGCVVALTEAGRCAELVAVLRETFYMPQGLRQDVIRDRLFVVEPSPGARVTRLPGD